MESMLPGRQTIDFSGLAEREWVRDLELSSI